MQERESNIKIVIVKALLQYENVIEERVQYKIVIVKARVWDKIAICQAVVFRTENNWSVDNNLHNDPDCL